VKCVLLNKANGTINRALVVAFCAQAVQYGAALTLIPFIVTRLTASEVGIWYVFVAMQGLAFITDFGFQPTFTRILAMAHSGAKTLVAKGFDNAPTEVREPNWQLVSEITTAARIFYSFVATVTLLMLLGFGIPYINNLTNRGGVEVENGLIAWCIFAIGISFNLSVQWIGPVLMGGGRIEANYWFIIANRLGFAITGICVLLAGGRLVALAACLIGAQLLSLLTVMPSLRRVSGGYHPLAGNRAGVRAVLRIIWPNASRMGVVAVGSFLITRYSMFAISTFVDLATAGAYALSLQLLMAVNGVAQMPMQVMMPRLVAARVERNHHQLRQMFFVSMILFIVLFALGGIFVLLAVPKLLYLIHSKVVLLTFATLSLLAIVLMLEGFHTNAAFFITTANEVPFVRAALLSGVAVAATATIAGWSGAGVASIILCQGVVQLAYNNWRWPLLAWREVRAAD